MKIFQNERENLGSRGPERATESRRSNCGNAAIHRVGAETARKARDAAGRRGHKQTTDLKNFNAGEPSTNSSGVQLDKSYREPIEVQIRALERKKKDLQSKIDTLYDQARKKDVAPGDLG